ncbi:hypothetical protein HanHA300_Chr02g0052481 [Helianthus annuus]|nr:hypothetical protein HanHA300_Chr02g0052481 [Helianthus annuus]
MILKNTGVYDGLTISQFIEKIESQDLEQQKIARMNSPSGQQDVKMYCRGSVPVTESERSPKIQTAFSAGDSSEKADQGSNKSSSGFSSFPSVNPKETNTSFQSQSTKTGNGYIIQCNIALNLPEGQSFSEDTAKDHMALLEKGHFKRECKGREASGAQNPFGKDDYYRKAIYQQVGQSQEPQTAHGRKIEDPKRACLVDFSWSNYISSEATAARIIDQDDEKLPEGFSWNMFVDEKGEFKAFIAKIVQEPDLFATWMKSIGETVKSEDEKSVSSESSDSTDKLSEHFGDVSESSDEGLQGSDEDLQSFDENVQNENVPEKNVVFDKTPTDSDVSDGDSDKSVKFDQSPDHSSSDDEEEKHINIAKTHLSPESFHFYFAERMEKLKEKRAAKEQQAESEGDIQNAENVAEKITEVVKEEEKVIEVDKVVEVVKTIEVEKIVEVVKPCEKCLEACKDCAAKDDIIAEYEKKKEQLLFNLNYVKESYDVLNKTVTGLQKTNSEREQALTMLNAVLITKQKAINFYIEESAKWKQELETEDKLSEHSGDVSESSDEGLQGSDEDLQSFDENVQNENVPEKNVVFDKTPTDSDVSDGDSDKSVKFDQSPDHSSSDDEEEKHINVAKTHLSPESFHFYFAERMEKLKEKRAAKEQQAESEGDIQNAENVAEKITEVVKEEEKVIEVEKVVEVVKTIEVEKIVEVVKPCEKCLEACKVCAAKDDIIAEYEKKKEQLLFNLNYVKESYDVLNKTVTGIQKTNSEREQALTMLNAVLMTKQKAINFYIEESAKWKQELETEKIENERIRRLLQSYSSSDYLIDRIYPTVAGMEAFKDEKLKDKKDCGKKSTVSYNKCPPPIWDDYSPRRPNEEQLEKAVNIKLKTDTTDVLPDNIDVTYTSSDIDHESELIKKVVDQVLDTDEES